MTTDAAAGAWLDQWKAAFAEQGETIAVRATSRGISDRGIRQSYPLAILFRRMVKRAADNQLPLCPHLDYLHPRPAYWLPWKPEYLRCGNCAAEAVLLPDGSPPPKVQAEDMVCDVDGSVSSTIDDMFSGYAQVIAATPLPVVIMFGICRKCAEDDGF